MACHYGDTEQQLSSSLSISSGAVFNRVMLFMLKEADGIFRRMLGLPADASSAAAAAAAGGKSAGVLLAEQVAKAQRWRKVGGAKVQVACQGSGTVTTCYLLVVGHISL